MAFAVKTKSMPGALMDRYLAHPSPNPETLAIQREAPDQEETGMEALRECIRCILDQELAGLLVAQRNVLIAFWTDCWGYSHEDTKARLLLPSVGASRAAKHQALFIYPCGHNGGCENMPGCAHQRGQEVWDDIAQRAIVRIKNGAQNDVHRK